jgi:hypothetical protein
MGFVSRPMCMSSIQNATRLAPLVQSVITNTPKAKYSFRAAAMFLFYCLRKKYIVFKIYYIRCTIVLTK